MKRVLFIFNIILTAISAAAIAVCASTPLFQFRIKSIKEEMFAETLKSSIWVVQEAESDATKEEKDAKVAENKAKLLEIAYSKTDKKGIVFDNLAIRLDLPLMMEMQKTDPKDRVGGLYDKVFDPMIHEIIENQTLHDVVMEYGKAMASKMAKKTIRDSIMEHMVSDADNKTLEFLENAGIDDAFLDEQFGNVYDALVQDGATINSVTDSVMDVLVATRTKFTEAAAENEEYKDYEDSEYMSNIEDHREEVSASLEEALKAENLVDDDGNIIDVDKALAIIIKGMMDESKSTSSSSSEGEGEKESLLLPKYAESETEEDEDLATVLSKLLKQKITEALFSDESKNAEYGETIGSVCRIGTIVVFAFIGLWVIMAITSILPIFNRKKPYKYMGAGYWVFIVLFGLVELVFGALLFVNPILSIVGNSVAMPEQLGWFSFSLYSSLSIVWVANTVLFFFSIAYAIIGHKVKKQMKAEKKAAAAVKAA